MHAPKGHPPFACVCHKSSASSAGRSAKHQHLVLVHTSVHVHTYQAAQPSGACEGVGCHVRALMVLHPLGSGMPTGMWSGQGALPSYCTLRPAAPSWHMFVMPCAFIGAWQSVCAPWRTIYRQAAPSWCILVRHAPPSWHIFVMRALPSMHGRPCVCPQAHNIRLQAG